LLAIFRTGRTERVAMPYTMEDYRKDYVREHMHKLPTEELLEIFRGLLLEDRITGVSDEDLGKLEEIIMKQRAQKSSGN
jgi:hypothetical protein